VRHDLDIGDLATAGGRAGISALHRIIAVIDDKNMVKFWDAKIGDVARIESGLKEGDRVLPNLAAKSPLG
jgi:hypothetical protein